MMRRGEDIGNGSETRGATMHWMKIAILAIGLLAPGMAVADSESPRDMAEAAFTETDANKDGRVNREEYYRRMADMYYQADRDKDGQLDRAELEMIEEDMVCDPADTNMDGTLTMPEYIDQRFKQFHDVDDDSDGRLSRDEVIEEYEETHAE